MNGSRGRPCLSDGVLVAFLDDALERRRREAVKRHLDECEVCRERLDTVRDRSELVGQWLRRHDAPAPPREAYDLGDARSGGASESRRGTGRERGMDSGRGKKGFRAGPWIAAAATVVLAIALAGPVMGWVADRIRDLTGPGEEQVAREDVDARTAFATSAREIEITFESPETGGTLVVVSATDSLVTLVAPADDIALTVRGGQVEVDNRSAPTGEYRLRVPEGVERLTYSIGEGDPASVDLGARTERPLRLELRSP